MWVSSSEELRQWNERAESYASSQADAALQIEPIGWNAYWTRLQSRLDAGEISDLVAMQSLRAYEFFGQTGEFLPLNEFIASDPDFDRADFDASMIEALSYDGQIYGLPFDTGPVVLYYNRTLFDQYGIRYPDDSWDWSDLLNAAEGLSRDGNHGIALTDMLSGIVYFLWGMGGEYYDEHTGVYDFIREENALAFQFVSDLFHVHEVARPLTEFANPQFHVEQFLNGNVGMFMEGPWQINNLKQADFEWGIAPVPATPTGRTTPVSGSGFAISSRTQHPLEAWTALRFLTGTDSLGRLAEVGRIFPARDSAVPSFVRGQPDIPGLSWVEDSLAFGRPFSGYHNWLDVERIVQDELQSLYLDPSITGSEIAARITERLRQYTPRVRD